MAGSSVRTTGVVAAELSNGLACATCHDSLTEYTLHPVTGVPFPSGKTVSFSEKDDAGRTPSRSRTTCALNATRAARVHRGR